MDNSKQCCKTVWVSNSCAYTWCTALHFSFTEWNSFYNCYIWYTNTVEMLHWTYSYYRLSII